LSQLLRIHLRQLLHRFALLVPPGEAADAKLVPNVNEGGNKACQKTAQQEAARPPWLRHCRR
jgi:hypothetical protein